MEDVPAVVGATAVVTLIVLLLGWTIWVVSRRGRERVQGQIDLQRRTLERFTSADELMTFIATDSGKRFLDSLATDHGAHAQRILSAMRMGIILVLAGAGLCLMPALERDLWPLSFFGIMALALGAGFLASAWASYRLARAWGLLPPPAVS